MAATLKNKSRQPVVVVLDHPVFATKANGMVRTSAKFGSTEADGTKNVTELRRTYPGSITILPGESVPDLHSAIALCSQVPGLVKSGVLQVIEQEEPRVVVKKQKAEDQEDAS